jgi:hypothetical protein
MLKINESNMESDNYTNLVSIELKSDSNNNYSTGIFSEKNTNFYFFPTALHVTIEENKKNMTCDEISSIISYLPMGFFIGDLVKFEIEAGFFMNYLGFTSNNSILTIPLDYKLFLQNTIFPRTQNIFPGPHPLKILIHNPQSTSGLKVSFSMDVEIKHTSSVNIDKSKVFFQHIQTLHVHDVNKLSIKQQLYFNHLTKGFFIAGDIGLIEELTFSLNGSDRFVYNDILLSTICVKLSDTCLYVPLDINEKFDDCNEKSFLSAVDLSRIDCAVIQIKCKSLPKKFTIYALSANWYQFYMNVPHLAHYN